MKALILTDIQNDFLPKGTLGVPSGNEILPIVQKLISRFEHVIVTQDWHPSNHVSFASTHHKTPGEIIHIGNMTQILWPTHCIQNTGGAEIAKEIDLKRVEKRIYKGLDQTIDGYSVFFDNGKKGSTGLDEYLKEKHLNKLYFCGFATDYCILYSVLDALSLGYEPYVIQDACRPINLHPDDEDKAYDKMKKRGAKLIQSMYLL